MCNTDHARFSRRSNLYRLVSPHGDVLETSEDPSKWDGSPDKTNRVEELGGGVLLAPAVVDDLFAGMLADLVGVYGQRGALERAIAELHALTFGG
jgi:hypothetical protein